ncbi:DUF1416 domain-containing protein, partial [Actinoplanes philippinensis]|uniref:DUF1416 domain-containing protein n=1 Tax=Actinoplanes philippinensis TaxID=35752 RepID=UPI0033EAC903
MTSPATNVASNVAAGCAAPDQSAPLPSSVDLAKETVITGIVRNADAEVVGGAYVRLLDGSGEFTAEVVSSPEGVFRFFAAPGSWTVRPPAEATGLFVHEGINVRVGINR